jgi:hypothetical protein
MPVQLIYRYPCRDFAFNDEYPAIIGIYAGIRQTLTGGFILRLFKLVR